MAEGTIEQPAKIAAPRYTTVAIALHWLIAALLLANVWYGLQMDQLRGLAKFEVFQVHKSIGITVLILTLARLAWRLVSRPPAYDPPLVGWEKWFSKLVHVGFYVVMLGLPLTGWAVVSVSTTNIPTLLFDAVPWPHIPGLHDLPTATRRALEDQFEDSHKLLVNLTYALIALHVAGALKHGFISRDAVVHRMIPLPFFRPKAS